MIHVMSIISFRRTEKYFRQMFELAKDNACVIMSDVKCIDFKIMFEDAEN
jgi:hypothetical protein